jgi:exodeoxyribonuclease VII small subunit
VLTLAEPKQKPVEGLSFEEALAELERIVGGLEGGTVPLEESIAMYERGEALRAHCAALLKKAEARIEKITASEGTATGTEPFDTGEA